MVTDRCGSVIWQAMDVIVWTGIRRANGGVQLPRARINECIKNPTISRAQRSAGTRCSASGLRRSGCRSHAPTTPAPDRAGTTGVQLNHARHTITPGTTRLERNHTHLESRCTQRAFRTTGACITPAQRAFSITGLRTTRCTTGTGTTESAERAFRKPDTPHPKRKGNDNHLTTGAERLGIQLPRARWKQASKTNDLAREAVCCNAGLACPLLFRATSIFL